MDAIGAQHALRSDRLVFCVRVGRKVTPDFAIPPLGNKFFSTVRPDGVTKGSGLGLAIVQQIMALHGGRMVVRNGEPGLRVKLDFG